MFCGKCGRSIPEGQEKCPFCEPAVQVKEEVPQTFYSEPSAPAAAPAQENFTLNTPEEEQPPKKKKGGLIALIAAGAVVLALALVAIFCWDSIAGMFKRNFAKPEEYLQYVEEENTKELAGDIAAVYDKTVAVNGSKETCYDTKIELELSDELVALLTTALEESDVEVDISWLESVTLEPEIEYYDNVIRFDAAVGLNDTSILTVSAIADLEKEEAYFAIPELNDTYLHMDLSEIMDEANFSVQNMEEATRQAELLMAAMPTGEQLEKLINKYLGIVFANLPEAEKDDKTLKAEGLEENAIVLSVDLSEKDLAKIVIAVLEALQEDQDVEDIITNMVKKVGEVENSLEMDPDEAYESFLDAIDEALDSMDTVKDEADTETLFTLKTYVNKKNEIIGRGLRIDGEELRYYTVTEGKKFGFYAGLDSAFEITGKGTRNGDKRTGTFALVVDNMEFLTVELEDFGVTEDHVLTGTVRLMPTSELLEEMDMDSITASLLDQIALELTFLKDGLAVAVESADDDLISLEITGSTKEASTINTPSDFVDVKDDVAGEKWASEMSLSEIIDNLEKAGVSDQFIDMLEELETTLAR